MQKKKKKKKLFLTQIYDLRGGHKLFEHSVKHYMFQKYFPYNVFVNKKWSLSSSPGQTS